MVEARLARLTVLHNPYADIPLGMDVLNGRDDVQWNKVESGGTTGYGPATWSDALPRDRGVMDQ